MSSWNKWIFGGLGWAIGGPIGGILGFALGSVTEESQRKYQAGDKLLPNDFSAVLLVLCAAVMKADHRVMRSELEFVKKYFVQQFGESHALERMQLFKEILKQEIPLAQVCMQVRQHLDPSSRLQLLHLLFGLASADGAVASAELTVLEQISHLIGIAHKDFESIKAMFVKSTESAYTILEIDRNASNEDLKKAYRRMAMKYHPDKVHHLGPEFQKDALEKFKKINEAHEAIRKERGI